MYVSPTDNIEDAVRLFREQLLYVVSSSKEGAKWDVYANEPERTDAQHKFYFANLGPLSLVLFDAGYKIPFGRKLLSPTVENLHDNCKHYLPINPKNGKQFKSTKDLSIKQFIEYLDRIFALWQGETFSQWTPLEAPYNYFKNNGYKFDDNGDIILPNTDIT